MTDPYKVEVSGANKTFNLEVVVDVELTENWATRETIYIPYIDSAVMLHGNRRREVAHLLTEEQVKEIMEKIEKQNDEIIAGLY